MSKMTLPAGKYYIGDPCYVIDNEKWDDFLGPFWNHGGRGGKFDFEGDDCVAFYTQYGDGQYELEGEGALLPVDAGMIGCIPKVMCHSDGDGADVTFDEPFECWEENGNLHFGDLVVKTGDDMEEEYD